MIKANLQLLLEQNEQQVQRIANKLNDANRFNRLSDDSATAIFMLQHIGEAMHSLANLLFGTPTTVEPKALFVPDNGQITQVDQAKNLIDTGFAALKAALDAMPDEPAAWQATAETPFGQLNKVQAFGFVLQHNNYHTGQAALAIKRGQPLRICQTWALNINELMLLLAGARLNQEVEKGVDGLEDDSLNEMMESLEEYFEDRPYMKSLFLLSGVIEGGLELDEFEEKIDEAIDDSLELYAQLQPNGIFLLRLPKATYHGTWRQETKQIHIQLLGLVRINELDPYAVEEGWEESEDGLKLEKEILTNVVVSAPLLLESMPSEDNPIAFTVDVQSINDVFLRINFESEGQTHQVQLSNVNSLGQQGLGDKIMQE